MKTLLILIISFITLLGCDDNGTNPKMDFEPYIGITEVADNGIVIKEDKQDWQADTAIVGNDTLILQPMPASPNPMPNAGAVINYGLNFWGVIDIGLYQASYDAKIGKAVEKK